MHSEKDRPKDPCLRFGLSFANLNRTTSAETLFHKLPSKKIGPRTPALKKRPLQGRGGVLKGAPKEATPCKAWGAHTSGASKEVPSPLTGRGGWSQVAVRGPLCGVRGGGLAFSIKFISIFIFRNSFFILSHLFFNTFCKSIKNYWKHIKILKI